MKPSSILLWVVRIIAAIIMLQTLYFKFSAAEESVFIFSEMGIEPWGRIATGIFELIASILILYRPTLIFGAILAAGIMSGAILSHLAVLGIVVKDDGGQLFAYALVVWICSAIIIWIEKQKIIQLVKKVNYK
ncbi:MAG: DoxX family protein [Chitinophagaceae bacterium]|nr:DoxX family protein [Chitinophagaceae bacterium]